MENLLLLFMYYAVASITLLIWIFILYVRKDQLAQYKDVQWIDGVKSYIQSASPNLYNITILALTSYPRKDLRGREDGWEIGAKQIEHKFSSLQKVTNDSILSYMSDTNLINDTTSVRARTYDDGVISISDIVTGEPLYVVHQSVVLDPKFS